MLVGVKRWERGIVRVGGLGAIALLCACPLPDRDIKVITEETNEAPVRLIEPVGLSRAQECECEPNARGCGEGDPPEPFEADCPQSLVIGVSHFLDPSAEPINEFCMCQEGFEDTSPFNAIEFFAEDQDRDPETGEAKDQLFAAILLNVSPEDTPSDHVAYGERYRSPTDPLPEATASYTPPGRPTPSVRRIFVGDDALQWDLCNGSNSPQIRQGFNTFTLLVTDRPWNEVTIPADPGAGISEETTIQQIGIVDIANGATFDTATYTFYCSSVDDTSNPFGEGVDPFGCVDRCKDPSEGG